MAVFFGAGAMTLTLYSVHVLARSHDLLPDTLRDSYLFHVLLLLGIGAVFAATYSRGPLEGVVRAASRAVAGVRAPGRCTRPSGWLQSADRWLASECAVAAFSVVVLEPWRKGGDSLVVAGEGLSIGPLDGQGSIEALHLAVLPRAVGTMNF